MPGLTLSKHTGRIVLAALAVAGLACARPAHAQDDGYHVGENQSAPPASARAVSPTHRVARIDYLSGNVTYRPNDTAKWVRAETNHPLLEGGQMWIEDGGRAEIRFDDGSILRLGSNSVITLQTVFVDAQGDYTQIKMNSGIATLEPRDERSVFEVNTPFLAVKTIGPSRIRIGVGSDVEVAVSRGRANLEGPQGKMTLNSGDFVSLRSEDSAYAVRALPAPDSWERWNEDRDRKSATQTYSDHRTPPSRSVLSIFLSLGFPIYGGGGDRHDGYHYSGRAEYHGEYHHRW
ncbi:MAG: FecR family protein [Chthonomonadaceae bacterium]|nr:FecR family protein [Chthonomonadaceae bacterium]